MKQLLWTKTNLYMKLASLTLCAIFCIGASVRSLAVSAFGNGQVSHGEVIVNNLANNTLKLCQSIKDEPDTCTKGLVVSYPGSGKVWVDRGDASLHSYPAGIWYENGGARAAVLDASTFSLACAVRFNIDNQGDFLNTKNGTWGITNNLDNGKSLVWTPTGTSGSGSTTLNMAKKIINGVTIWTLNNKNCSNNYCGEIQLIQGQYGNCTPDEVSVSFDSNSEMYYTVTVSVLPKSSTLTNPCMDDASRKFTCFPSGQSTW